MILSLKRKQGVIVGPLNWCTIRFLENSSSIMVLCNYKFLEKEYIRNFKNFLKY